MQVRDPDEVLVGEPGRWLPQPGATLSHRSGARQAPAKLVSPGFRAKTLMQLGRSPSGFLPLTYAPPTSDDALHTSLESPAYSPLFGFQLAEAGLSISRNANYN